MRPLSTLLSLLRPLTWLELRRIRREVDDEIRFHIDSHVADCLRRGMSPEQAVGQARERFGDAASISAECVRLRTEHPLRVGLRTVETVVTLAVASGFGAAVLLLANGVLLRSPVPFHDQAHRVAVWWYDTAADRYSSGSTVDEFATLSAMTDVFEHVTASRYAKVDVVGAAAPERVRAKYVSADYFRLFGADALAGRLLDRDAYEPSAPPSAVLGYELCRRQFGAEERALGRSIEVDGREHTVVGVMPPTMPMYLDTALFLPLPGPAPVDDSRGLLVAARLRHDVSYATVRSRVAEVFAARTTRRATVRKLEEVYSAEVRPRLFSEIALAGVLLLALFAHAVQRRISIQPSAESEASASRWLRTSVFENVLVAMVAAWIGLLLARNAAIALVPAVIGEKSALYDIGPDRRVALLTFALAGLAGVTLGWLSWRVRQRADGRRPPPRQRARVALVTVEVALALVLLLCVAGPARSLARAGLTAPGFSAERLFVIDVSASGRVGGSRTDLLDAVLERARAVPGVASAGLTHAFPIRDRPWRLAFRDPAHSEILLQADFTAVSPGHTALMGIPLVHGRRLLPADAAAAGDVVLINRALAERLAGAGADPVGRVLRTDPGDERFEIVGVVENVRRHGLDAPPEPMVYRPYAQCPGAGTLAVVVRTSAGGGEAAGAVARALRDLDRKLPVAAPVAATNVLRASLRELRLRTMWLGLLAAVALAYALLDLAGLVADSLGRSAGRRSVAGSVGPALRETLAISAVGAAVAAPLAWGLARADWPTFEALRRIDLATAAAVLALLVGAASLTVAAVALYARSLARSARTP